MASIDDLQPLVPIRDEGLAELNPLPSPPCFDVHITRPIQQHSSTDPSYTFSIR